MASLKYKKKKTVEGPARKKSPERSVFGHTVRAQKKKRFDDDGRRFSFYFFDVSGIFRKGKQNFIKSPRGAKLEFFFYFFFFQKPEIYWLVSINTVRHFSLAAIHWQHLIATAALGDLRAWPHQHIFRRINRRSSSWPPLGFHWTEIIMPPLWLPLQTEMDSNWRQISLLHANVTSKMAPISMKAAPFDRLAHAFEPKPIK